jgi:polyisoprenyl-phosphate glycosyltransferase
VTDSIPAPRTVISVVVPLYNEEKNVPAFVERLNEVFERLKCDWELVFALDPSPDGTRETIVEYIRKGYPIRLVTFSRRMGKPVSLLAGLDHSRGDACVIMDVDLQDPPELIEEMVNKWREGYKVVIAQRVSRKGENFLYVKAAHLFYRILERISEVKVPYNTGDFRLLDARVVREVCRFRERHGFLRGITAAVGFPTALIPFDRDARFKGKSQISILGAVNIALDGIVPFSRTPLRLIFLAGFLVLGLGILGALVGVVHGTLYGLSPLWPLMLLGVLMTVLSGVILVSMGILGEYLVRTYEETRDRPLYIVDEITEAETLPCRSFPETAS